MWSLQLAARFSAATVTGQDLPKVLEESFLPRAAAEGLSERVRTLPGDMQTVALPAAQYDLIVVANVLRLEPAERAARLIARLVPALAPGGALLIIDAIAGGTPERERARALYALHLAIRSTEGSVHLPATLSGWLAAAGLSDVRAIELPDWAAPTGALLARRA